MRTSALFGAKTLIFSKLMVCPHGQGGFSQCGPFAYKEGGGVNFSRFCAEAFMNGSLQVLYGSRISFYSYYPHFFSKHQLFNNSVILFPLS